MAGSLERMLAILAEHYAGKWPFWLSPRQVALLPVCSVLLANQLFVVLLFTVLQLNDEAADWAYEYAGELRRAGIAVEVDASNRTVNKKVREAQQLKFNTICVVGEKEMKDDSVSIRFRDSETFAEFQRLLDDRSSSDQQEEPSPTLVVPRSIFTQICGGLARSAEQV